jgi:MFS family permease
MVIGRAAGTRAAVGRLSALVPERALFQNDSYRRLWVSRLLSQVPSNAVVYTMLILVVEATGKSFSSSLFVAAYIAPAAVLGSFAGVLVDQFPKGVMIAGAHAARAGLCALLAIAVDDVALIYILAVGFAIAGQLSGPGESAALPALVEAEEYTAANSLNNLGGIIAQIFGIVLLPVVFLNTVGAEALAIVCGVMFGLAAFNVLTIHGLAGRISEVDMTIADAREQFAQAWERLTKDSVAYLSVIVAVLANTTGLVVATLLPRYATQVLDIRIENTIFVVAPAVIGMWAALRFAQRVSGSISPWWSVGGFFAVFVVGVTLCAFVPQIADSLPFDPTVSRIIITMMLAPVLAFAFTLVNVVTRSVVNERIPRDMQGRVFAAQGTLTNLASIPPILLTGLLADLAGVSFVFFLVGVVSGLATLYMVARNLASPARAAA